MLKLCKIHACPNGTLGLHLSRAPWDPYPWVSGVQEGSNAYQAGVRSGDTVLELNGFDVLGQKISEMAMKIDNHWEGGGSFVTMLIWRNKTENNAVNQQSLQKFAKCLQHIAQLLECPICLEIVKPPGWQCCNGHVLCNSCRGRTVKCPICRVTLGPRGRCLLSDKLFILLAETFPCDGVKSGNSSSDCPKAYNGCHEAPLINSNIDSPSPSASSSPTLNKVHHRKQITSNFVLENIKKPDNDSRQFGAGKDRSSLDDNIVVLKFNQKSKKKNDFTEYGSCHHHHHYQGKQQELLHHHHPHHQSLSLPSRRLLSRQRRTFHCPTGKSTCSLLYNATEANIASNKSRSIPVVDTLNCIWTREIHFRKSKGQEEEDDTETLRKLITEWDILSHLTQVHQISVAQHYTAFFQPVQLQLIPNTKSIPCITIQSERTWTQNKENFKNNVNVSVGGVFFPIEYQEHASERGYKNSTTTSAPKKNVQHPTTELFFVACIPINNDDDDEEMETTLEQDELQNEMNDVNADILDDIPPPQCLKPELDDTGDVLCAGSIETATKSKINMKSTLSQTNGHLIQEPGTKLQYTTSQSRVNIERSPISTRSSCTDSPNVDACTWCTSSSSSSSSSSSMSCSSSLASFSMSSSSYRCCSNTMTRQHAIFIWYFGSECDVKNFETVIECKRTGLKWTGCVHPLTKSWSSIRRGKHMEQFLVLNSMPDDGDNFFNIVIKMK